MIRYRRYENSPDCFELVFLDPKDLRERREHVHISEIRRFFGHKPNEVVVYNDSDLSKFFTYKAELLGSRGEYFQKNPRRHAKINPTRRRDKPNSPGEG